MIVTITGPSAAGKTSIEAALTQKGLFRIKSTTTRKPRNDEIKGKDYDFISEEKFLQMLYQNQFVEHVKYGSNLYGVTVPNLNAVLDKGSIVVVCEPVGLKQFREYATIAGIELHSVHVSCKLDTRIERIKNRNENIETEYQRIMLTTSEESWETENSWDIQVVTDDKSPSELADEILNQLAELNAYSKVV